MEKLVEILKKVKPDVDFKNQNNLVKEGILDSLEIVEIVTEIEKEYKIEIAPEQIDPDNFQSVDAMWEMIQGINT